MDSYKRPKRIVIPPVWFLLGLIAVFLFDRYYPVASFASSLVSAAGAVLAHLGLLSVISSARLFSKTDTGIVPFSEATTLVTSGAFRYSRNPMYLGMALVLFGAACMLGSVSGLIVTPLFMLIIQMRFIRDEERMMREVFGEEYGRYCAGVRRWL